LSKEKILHYISEIQQEFPDELLEKLFLEKVTENNFDELLARSLITFPPIYLPIFVRDGDLFGIHLSFENELKDRPWFKLSHDCEYPLYLVSQLKFMPYAFLDGILNIKRYYDEILSFIKDMLSRSNLSIPNKNYFIEKKDDYYSIIADYDYENHLIRLYLNTRALLKKKAYNEVRIIYEENRSDKLLLAGFLFLNIYINKNNVNYDDVIFILKNDFSYSLPSMFWLSGISTGPELLNEIKKSLSEKLEKENPFYLINDDDYTDQKIIPKLITIANSYNEKGDYITALNQLRNAATVAGAHGTGVTKELCVKLGEQSKLIDSNSLAGDLALYVSEIINRGV
jgi:hypothetical protein